MRWAALQRRFGERDPDMRKRLKNAWMLTATAAIATSFSLKAPAVWAAEGDGSSLTATTDAHGRKIYVNDEAPTKPRHEEAAAPRRSSLMYWSTRPTGGSRCLPREPHRCRRRGR